MISVGEMVRGFWRGVRAIHGWHQNKGILKGLHDELQALDKDGDGKLSISELLALTGKQVGSRIIFFYKNKSKLGISRVGDVRLVR